MTREDGEIKKSRPMRLVNQLSYRRNSEAGGEVTSVRAAAAAAAGAAGCILSARCFRQLHLMSVVSAGLCC